MEDKRQYRQIKSIDITKIKQNPEKANVKKHSKTKLPTFSRLLRHSARKRGGLVNNAHEPTRGQNNNNFQLIKCSPELKKME